MPPMYLPAHFAVEERAEIAAMVAAIPAGHLVTAGGGLAATFLPVLCDLDAGVVRGHMARANPHWKAIGPSGTPALVILRGASGYVSPGWYPSKQTTGKVVPTWNYELVHLHGTARVIDGPAFVEGVVRELTERHERGQRQPWSVDDAPADYISAQLRAIVGVEVVIERVEAKRKMSQNRSDADVAGVIAATDPADPFGAAMRAANGG